MKKVFLLLMVPALMFQSCATILGGGGAKVIPISVSAEDGIVKDYEIFINGISYGMADQVEVVKGDLITIEADGFKKSVTAIQGKFNGTVLLNLIWGGLIGIVIDVVTDNHQKVTTPMVNAKLRPEM